MEYGGAGMSANKKEGKNDDTSLDTILSMLQNVNRGLDRMIEIKEEENRKCREEV